MKLYTCVQDIKDLKLQGSVLTVGNFDGLHRGHQKLIEKTQFLAQKHWLKSVMLTFRPHPRQVLSQLALKGQPSLRGPGGQNPPFKQGPGGQSPPFKQGPGGQV